MGYGCIGNAAFRYFILDIADGITATGRLAIRYIANVLNEFLNKECGTTGVEYSIYSDTDSGFISLEKVLEKNNIDMTDTNACIDFMDDYMKNVVEPHIREKYKELSDYLGAKENLLIMKREALADSTIFRGKKNYIMQVFDLEGVRFLTEPYLKFMGVETAKTSTAKIIRNKLSECFKIVLNKDKYTAKDLKLVVDNFRTEFNQIDINSIAAPRGITDIDKWLDKDNNIIKGCPIHVRAAITYNNFIDSNEDYRAKYEKIQNGNKIKFVKLKEPNILHSHVVAFIDEVPFEMELDSFVDKKSQFDETFLAPLETFTSLIDWDIRRNVNINSLFGDEDEDNYRPVVNTPVQKTVAKKKLTIDNLF